MRSRPRSRCFPRSDDPAADVDYFFAQVAVEERLVDYGPTCGNILAGVGPAAVEMGLVPIAGDETRIRIRAVNTGALVEAVVQTPDGAVRYDGDAALDGVPGTAAPVALNFLDVVGSRCGTMLPTGKALDTIDGFEVTCIDVAMPMMIARAADLGITGHESQAELDENKTLFERMESLRLEAGRRMGLGDVSKSVTPKIGLIAEPRAGGHLTARYFMPWSTHPTMAVTGSQMPRRLRPRTRHCCRGFGKACADITCRRDDRASDGRDGGHRHVLEGR